MGSVAPITATGTRRLRAVAITAVVGAALTAGACNDLRDFRGAWTGPRVGDAAPLKVGVADGATARLDIGQIDLHGLAGTLSVDGLVTAAPLEPVAGAEADVLAGMSFDGSPLRVYLGFVPVDDGAGDATAVVSLYDDDRVELRLLRGGAATIYAIFALEQ